MKRALLLLAAVAFSFLAAISHAAPSDIGIVLMHGKGGSPGRFVSDLATALEFHGYLVANIEMPWSRKRQYDVDMNTSDREIATAVEALRAKGAKKVFVAGHSQGAVNALLFAGKHRVDGVIAIAPGGSHGAGPFRDALGSYVSKAKSLIEAGRGDEKYQFADMEGSKGTFPITTTAAIYYDWFNPDGPHNVDYACRNVMGGTPALYIAPTRDYPGLIQGKFLNFRALPSHPLTRMYEPESDHLHAPEASSGEIIRWMNEVAGG